MVTFLEWSGALVGILGALLLALNSDISHYGWLAFLIANLVMIVFAWRIDRYGLLVQQLGFTCTTLLGIYRAFPINLISTFH